jgi:ribosomal protein L37AE/L43A
MGERRSYRIETFDALLRDLVTWGLVVRTGKTRRSWRLVDAAQSRLDVLERHSGPLEADQLVYFDHFCADCHHRTLTRLHDALYLCDACRQRRETPTSEEEVSPKPGSKGLRARRRHGSGRRLAG